VLALGKLKKLDRLLLWWRWLLSPPKMLAPMPEPCRVRERLRLDLRWWCEWEDEWCFLCLDEWCDRPLMTDPASKSKKPIFDESLRRKRGRCELRVR